MKVGITGHQDLGPRETRDWVSRTLDRILSRERVTEGLTCLARGADQIFARRLRRLKVPYTAIIPCAWYVKSFTAQRDRAAYQALFAQAWSRVTLPFREPGERAYMEAGRRLVELCDLLVAVWDGKPAAGLGGTADVVAYARRLGRRILHVDPIRRRVRTISPAAGKAARPRGRRSRARAAPR